MKYFVMAVAFLGFSFNTSAKAIPGQYLVKVKPTAAHMGTVISLSDEFPQAQVEVVSPEHNIVLVKSNEEIRHRLQSRPDVAHVQPNFRYRTMLHIAKPAPRSPAEQVRGEDELLDEDRDLKLANVLPAWNFETGSREVVVAVLDTGVDYNHEDLAANMWRDPENPEIVGWDFIDNDAFPYDVTSDFINPFTGDGNAGHGTHCAGNIGAVGGNRIGISGVAKRVSIMAVRMLDDQGNGDTIASAKAVDWAVEHGARIISASWGSEGITEEDLLLKEAIERAADKGVLFVAAAGNTASSEQKDADNDNNEERRVYPASFDLSNIISVAAINRRGKLADFSFYGAKSVHLAAPGEKSFSTVPTNRDRKNYVKPGLYEDGFSMRGIGFVPWNGTSMATPHVAGAAALLLSKHPHWNYMQVKRRILSTVRPVPSLKGKVSTGGVLDVAATLRD